MSRKIKMALIGVAVISFGIAASYPIGYFLEQKSMDDDMERLRALKNQVQQETQIPRETRLPENAAETQSAPMDMGQQTRASDADNAVENMPVSADASAPTVNVQDGETKAAPEGKDTAPDETDAASGGAEAVSDETDTAPQETEAVSDETDTASEGTNAVSTETAPALLAYITQPANGAAADMPKSAASPVVTAQPTQEPTPLPTPTPFVFDESRISHEYRELYQQNHDLVGWLMIDDTIIDYPVLQTENDEYYLTHDFYGEPNNNGQLILNSGCDINAPSQNLVVSAHNMNSGKMFAGIVHYKSMDYWKEHPVISLDTLFEKRRYQVFAVYYTSMQEGDLRFDVDLSYRRTMKEYLASVDEIKRYDTGVDVTTDDEVLTLTTCSYQKKDGRFVVLAKRIS